MTAAENGTTYYRIITDPVEVERISRLDKPQAPLEVFDRGGGTPVRFILDHNGEYTLFDVDEDALKEFNTRGDKRVEVMLAYALAIVSPNRVISAKLNGAADNDSFFWEEPSN